MWIAITLVFLMITILASLVPLIGSFASTILTPVLAAGMMAGCRALDRGDQLTINHLFAGFSERLGSLLVVGLLCLAGTVVILVVMLAIAVGTIGMSGIGALMSGDPIQGGLTMLATLGLGAMVATLVGMLVALPLMMAYWFAPALVILRNDEPVAAMKASFVACWVNIGSMLVYGLVGHRAGDRRDDPLRPRLVRPGAGDRHQHLRELQGHLQRACVTAGGNLQASAPAPSWGRRRRRRQAARTAR